MIIVAFLLPLALYLLALSWVNRQPQPVVVAGTWDFIGLLFAASGFLFVGGPAVLSSLNERWRRLWLLGDTSSLPDGLDHFREIGLLLAAGYFVAVVAGAGWMLARRRRLTCVYNVEPDEVVTALDDAFRLFGLRPIRSGNLFVFGSEGQAPREMQPGKGSALLDVESFPALKHVTLSWEPADSPLRAAVEADLRRRLAVTAAPHHESAVWFNLAGTTLLVASLFVVALLIARMTFLR